MLGGDFQDMLRCIRCGACLNHCPVYGAIGGHAYGSLYPGPMGAVLTPALLGIDHARDLPNASSFCGRCEEVCPMAIPLPSMMRQWRERDFARAIRRFCERLALRLWAFAAKRPRLYHALAARSRRCSPGARGTVGISSRSPSPRPGPRTRDLPAPQGKTFHQLYAGDAEEQGAMTRDHQPALMVLSRIRAAPRRRGQDERARGSRRRAAERHPRGTIPGARAGGTARAWSTVHGMLSEPRRGCDAAPRTPKEAVNAIAAYLGASRLPPRCAWAPTPCLPALPWKEAPEHRARLRPAERPIAPLCPVPWSRAAETGTLFLVSGADNPTTLAFLPETHIVLIAASDIVGSYEQAWDRLRAIYGDGALPRSVNLISGPSRTADIEQTIVRGAHGPKRLHVVILG